LGAAISASLVMSSRLGSTFVGSDSVGVGIPTYAGEDVKAALGELAGGGGADSRRGPGHHDERMTEWDVCLSRDFHFQF
jgi:hypothetical protein